MKQFIKSYAIIALGSLIFALGFDWFFAPNQIAMGGVTGLAQVINVLIPALPVGVLTIILNIPLFLAGMEAHRLSPAGFLPVFHGGEFGGH